MRIKKHYAYLSAAIREGAKLRPQAFTDSFPAQFRYGTACAMAAGIEAIYGRAAVDDTCAADLIFRLFPYLASGSECPLEPEYPGGWYMVYGVAVHLNDEHQWSREQIADWLYAEEEKLGFETLIETETSPELSLEIQDVEKHGAVCLLP